LGATIADEGFAAAPVGPSMDFDGREEERDEGVAQPTRPKPDSNPMWAWAEPGPAAADPPPSAPPFAPPNAAPPYATAYPPPYSAAAASVPGYESSRRLSRFAIGLIAIAGLVALAGVVHFVVGLQLIARTHSGDVTLSELSAFDDLTRTVSWAQIIVSLVSGVVFLRWLWRSVGNAVALGARPGIVDPRGAVTAWLVPIRNLWKPYRVVVDLHGRLLEPLASDSGRLLIGLWWAFWIAGDVVGVLVLPWIHPAALPDMARLWLFTILSSAVTAADAILAIAVMLQLERLADARRTANDGDPVSAMALVERARHARVTHVPLVLALAVLAAASLPLALTYPAAADVGSASGSWQSYTAADGSFSVDLPGRPVVVTLPVADEGGVTTTGQSVTARASADASYAITYHDYPPGLLSTISASQAYANMVAALDNKTLVSSRHQISVGGLPAEEIRAVRLDVTIRAWFCVDGDRVYVVEADTSAALAASPDVDRFFDSFRLR
jgi:hypothetical protein